MLWDRCGSRGEAQHRARDEANVASNPHHTKDQRSSNIRFALIPRSAEHAAQLCVANRKSFSFSTQCGASPEMEFPACCRTSALSRQLCSRLQIRTAGGKRVRYNIHRRPCPKLLQDSRRASAVPSSAAQPERVLSTHQKDDSDAAGLAFGSES